MQPLKPVVATDLLKKACELRVLGHIWAKDKQSSLTARLTRLRLSPWPCLILLPEVPSAAKSLHRASSQNLSFRLGASQYSGTMRVLFYLRGRIVCTIPKDLSLTLTRRGTRHEQDVSKDVVCEFGHDLPRFYPPGLVPSLDVNRRSRVQVVDISAGGLRVRVKQTKHALALDIGEIFRHVKLVLLNRSEQLVVPCHIELVNIMVREEWTEGSEDASPARTRATYLGFVFTNLNHQTAEELQRFVHAVAWAPSASAELDPSPAAAPIPYPAMRRTS